MEIATLICSLIGAAAGILAIFGWDVRKILDRKRQDKEFEIWKKAERERREAWDSMVR